MKLWYPQDSTVPLLILVCDDYQVMLYQGISNFDEESQERFRFKIVESHVLIAPRINPLSQESFSHDLIHIEGKMALVLHPSRTFAIFIRNGKPICIYVGKQQGCSLLSVTAFAQGFVGLRNEKAASKIIKFKFPQRFDPRMPALKLAEGYLLKQHVFKDRGIKKIKMFNPTVAGAAGNSNSEQEPHPHQGKQFIFVATYQHRVPGGRRTGVDEDFVPSTRAPAIFYTLEVI